MFGRPRCREWTPLTTQQLRLRSLIQIVGYNIRPPEGCHQQCSYYITLHHTTMSAPFYTSERICSPHPKWKEIDPEITQRMSSTNVVIRIWCHILSLSSKHDVDASNRPQDTVIETWGVYFSGLRYLGANLASNFNSDCFKTNTLVFQMHGGYFCSYKSLKLDIIPPETEHGSMSSDSSSKTPRGNHETKIIQAKFKDSRPASPCRYKDKEYSKSQSPVERGFKQNFPTVKSRSTMNIHLNHRDGKRDETKITDPNHIYEHSPNNLDVKEFTSDSCDVNEDESPNKVDLSETAESYDLRNEMDGTPKYRYLAMNFLKSEIRPSYNASKLQSLHLLQYSIKKKQEAVQEIKERIYKKSALTESLSQNSERLRSKSTSFRNLFAPDEDSSRDKVNNEENGRIKEEKPPVSIGPRLTLKLNDLLSYKTKPSPFQRSEHIRLTKQLEILHFKRLILSDERDAKLANIRRLKEKHAKLFEENQDVGSELMQNYHALSRWAEKYRESRESCSATRELAARSHAALANRRADLLQQLHKIFYIDQKDSTTWSICGVPLPICGDDTALNPLPDAVAAGFVAQAVCIAATVLNQPLRYKITLLGSASKILDVTPDLPDPNIPLFARGGDGTLFRYAMFLLNKCVAQLLWGRGLSVYDMRPTLANLQRLLLTPTNLSDTSKLFGTYRWLAENQCPRTQSLRSLVTSDRSKYRQFNRFKDAVDGQSPQKAMNNRRHKHSRSVGSYHDDQELSTLHVSTASIMGSDSNIYNMKLSEAKSDSAPYMKSHNSDSAISNQIIGCGLAECNPEKVIFTLGDDLTELNLETHLVRISTNNDDRIQDNVKRICNEITDFCSGSDIDENLFNTFDITKHLGMESDTYEEIETSEDRERENKTREIKRQVSGDIDIVKYMERKVSVEVESADIACDTCDKNIDGVCDIACSNTVRDVIVIPSAEAMLDSVQEGME